MTLQELQTELFNIIANERIDPNSTHVVFDSKKTSEVLSVNRVQLSYNGHEVVIILKD